LFFPSPAPVPGIHARRVTDPSGHHFFGYYEKSTWDADESALACLHSGFVSHYDWRIDGELLAWTDRDGRAFYRYDLDGGATPDADDGYRLAMPPVGLSSTETAFAR